MNSTNYIAMTHTGPAPVYATDIINEQADEINKLRVVLEFLLERTGFEKSILDLDMEQLEKILNRDKCINDIIDEK